MARAQATTTPNAQADNDTFETVRDAAAETGANLRDAAERSADAAKEAGRKVGEAAEAAMDSAAEAARDVNAKLKSVGIDTDVMMGAAKDQADTLQKLIADELAERPWRTLGLAAAAGIVLGFLSSR